MRKLLLGLLVVVSVAALLVVGTAAYFSYTATASSGDTVQTAELMLHTDETTNIPMNVTNLVPGQWTGWSKARVFNDSGVPVFFYIAAARLQGDLADDLVIQVTDAGDTEIYNGPLCNLVTPVLASNATWWHDDVDPVDMIPPAYNQYLWFRVLLPETNTAQDLQDLTEIFDLEVTATTALMP